MRTLCSAVLAMEAVLVLLAMPLAAGGVTPERQPWVIAVGVGLMVLLIISIGGLRRGWGVVLGWILQFLLLLTGVLVPLMFVLGAIFLALWIAAVVIGGRVDRRRSLGPPAVG